MHLYVAPVQCSNYTLINKIVEQLTDNLNLSISVIEIPIDIARSFSKERGQYFSTQLLSDTLALTQHLDGKILILVEFDLFVPVFTYVFGEAQLNGKLSIVSLCRLHEEFYSDETNDKLLLDRALKEALHEIGHNFGLLHCRDWNCVMHSSQGIEEVDIKGSRFCDKCQGNVPVKPLLFQ